MIISSTKSTLFLFFLCIVVELFAGDYLGPDVTVQGNTYLRAEEDRGDTFQSIGTVKFTFQQAEGEKGGYFKYEYTRVYRTISNTLEKKVKWSKWINDKSAKKQGFVFILGNFMNMRPGTEFTLASCLDEKREPAQWKGLYVLKFENDHTSPSGKKYRCYSLVRHDVFVKMKKKYDSTF
ncbi:MAG: hypothetical protein J6X49_11640 [Victivallales bacterium]|nr:hypothetical protein [Victivallales bacterium]